MTDHSKLIERIKNLRARASDGASSQSEATAAAARAAKLISEHEINEDELRAMGTSGASEGAHNDGRRRTHPTMNIVSFAIGDLTECKSLIRGGGANLWVGQPSDVEFALYLSELIQGAAERAWKIHLRKTGLCSARRDRNLYLMGFGWGVLDKLAELAEERRANRTAPTMGTSIVIIKDQLINSYLDEKYGDIKPKRRSKQKNPSATTALAGMLDGKKCRIDNPVERDRERQVLGGDAA